MATNLDSLKQVRQRTYIARDFDGLRASILEYARLYYPNRLQDFSETSLGGLFLDIASYVGDNLSFYLDHQYGELNYETAVETVNVQRNLRTAGVLVTGASPAVVPVTVFIEVPAIVFNNQIIPDPSSLPIVQTNSVFVSDSGVSFILLEDLDFTKNNSDGSLAAEAKIGAKSSTGLIQTFLLALSGMCVSGQETTETTVIGSQFVPFLKIQLNQPNVTAIVGVNDDYGNLYYEVDDLSNDVVYKNVLNTAKDNNIVPNAIKVVPAPYRYTSATDLSSRRMTLTMGGGSATTLQDDVFPDPSTFAISFPYAQTFSRLAVNPQQLLQTKTLGVYSVNTTLTVTYRYGGGLDHNVSADNIRTPKTVHMFFPGNPPAAAAARVRNSIECTNRIRASGGEDAPTADELTALIPSIKNSQERIVTREDLIARVYTIPANFGRVFRAAVRSNPNNPLATQLFIVSRSPDQTLITSPDTLKQNLVTYLNPYRMISDAIDILDASIINLTVSFSVVVDPSLNKSTVIQNILAKLQTTFNVTNYHIDQPLIISDITNAIYSVLGIISLDQILVKNITGMVNNRVYSNTTFNVASNTTKGIIIPPPGGIFEVRYTDVDVIGKAL